MISVVIPVKNGGTDIVRCLDAIARQRTEDDTEIVIVDSGSTDGSVHRAERLGARVQQIAAHDFNHGRARNLGAELARGEILVFTTQDAYAADDRWLTTLVAPLRERNDVAGVYGRQIAYETASPPERYFLDFLYGSRAREQRIADPADLSFERTLFSNVNSALRREAWKAYPFAEDILMGEDQEWARRVLVAGYTIVYEPRAAVRHSHAYSVASAFRRFFDSGASADRTYVTKHRGSRSALRRAALSYARGEIAWLIRTGQHSRIPQTALYELSKFTGLQLGLRHERLPVGLKRRLSSMPSFWESEGQSAPPTASVTTPRSRLSVCLVYDHVFPQTVGGGERWMRDLAVRLSASDCDVTYLTMRHWGSQPPAIPGVRVIGLTRPGRVYRDERRTLWPPLRFGVAVGLHLLRRGAEYDVVHIGSFPYFPVLAAGVLRPRMRYELVVDWLEVWTPAYWRRYAGPVIGTLGWLVQNACVHVNHTAHCLSRLHAERLSAAGYRGTPAILPGLYGGPVDATPSEDVDPELIVYAGRHVREKRVPALVRGFAFAMRKRPGLRLELYGEGPERRRIEEIILDLGVAGSARVLGHRPEEEVAAAIGRAACLATASEREGYGLVVVEAAARGTPSVVIAGPENAAIELVRDGVNGAIAPDESPEAIAGALVRVLDAGLPLRDSTVRWFEENAESLRIDRSLELVERVYKTLART